MIFKNVHKNSVELLTSHDEKMVENILKYN